MASVLAGSAWLRSQDNPPSNVSICLRHLLFVFVGVPLLAVTAIPLSIVYFALSHLVRRHDRYKHASSLPALRDETVVIIGAGWSGITAAKHAVQEGFKVIVIERREDIGGIWNYSDDPDVVSVMRSTITSSSLCVSEFCDYPFPIDTPDFIPQRDMHAYLKGYRDHFLSDTRRCRFVFNAVVNTCNKTDVGKWSVFANNGQQFTSDYLMVCTGVHGRPNMSAKSDVFEGFRGEVMHSASIKEVDKGTFGNKRVLVFGGGETSSDIVHHLVNVASDISWAIPTGSNFPSVYGFKQPSDMYVSLFHTMYAWCVGATPESIAFTEMLNTEGNCGGHGIKAWRSACTLDRTFCNKSSDSLQYVYDGRVKPRRCVVKCSGNTVTWDNGKQEDFDVVVLCTGYSYSLSFLPKGLRDLQVNSLYQFMYHIDDPSLMFLGFARPTLFSLFTVAETQARHAAEVLSGRLKLPKAMREKATDYRAAHAHYYRSRAKRLNLVHQYNYTFSLAEEAGFTPNLLRLFMTKPLVWLVVFFGPFNGYTFRANEVSTHDVIAHYSRFNVAHNVFASLVAMTLHGFGAYKFSKWLDPAGGGPQKRYCVENNLHRLYPKPILKDA